MTQTAFELTVLCCHQNKQLWTPVNNRKNGTIAPNEDNISIETIKKQIRNQLNRRLDEELGRLIETEDMEVIVFEDNTPNLRYYYEEEGLHRFKITIHLRKCPSNEALRALKEKLLTKICSFELLSNTRLSISDRKSDWFTSLSANNKMNTRFRMNAINSFSLGTLIDLTNFVEHYTSYSESTRDQPFRVAKEDIFSDFRFDLKSLEVIFRTTNGGHHKKNTQSFRYKLQYDFKYINSFIFNVQPNGESMKIYMTFNSPPLLSKVAIDDMNPNEKLEYYRSKERKKPNGKLFDTIDGKEICRTDEIKSDAVFLRVNKFEGCRKQIIGQSNVLMMEIRLIKDEDRARESGRDLWDPYRLLSLTKHFTAIPIYFGYIERHDCSPRQAFIDLKKEFSQDFNKEMKNHQKLINEVINVFDDEYAFNALFSLNFVPFDELFFKNQTKEFVEKVINCSKIDFKAVEDTLFELFALNDRSVTFCVVNAFDKIFKEFKERNEKCRKEELSLKSIDSNIVYIRKCILTPTRLIMLPPQPTLKSRFVDESEPDYTLRLSIREDNLQSLQYSVGNLDITQYFSSQKDSILQKMIKKPLLEGIKIGDRNYEFLGSSTSQLRDTGLILYAKDTNGKTARKIIDEIGDLEQYESNVPKYVARLGLAFSQVFTHIVVTKSQTYEEPDIERNDFNFSDGIGRVSSKIMQKVYANLKIECKHRPCAMQIRYGGCKGMLVIDPNLEGKKIVFRESMVKYDSDSDKLGIIKLSHPRPLYLNRPLITILDQLGIEDKVFLQMLFSDLKLLSNSMLCECWATKLLQNSSTLGIPYRKLFESEFPFLTEPLFRQIIDSVINHRITELKAKGRIKLPMEMGRNVFGVLDETATLEYGQVFVQLSKVDQDNMPLIGKDSTIILKGEIMVTKFPCMHPGDVRKLEAVDVPQLRHIKDCIVFPQKGERPHPNEMAGSDLDGDEYAVIWDSPLIFEGENKKAMDFPESEPKLLEKDAKIEDIIDFYCDYIVNNNVGLIASAHLARADTEEEGINSQVCMSLAKKYSVALDFAKTGTVERIEWSERPFVYPDFMEKFALKRTKLSRRILGQLYRQCDRISLGMHSNKKIEIKAEANEYLKIDGYEEYMSSAKTRYNEYKLSIDSILNRFGLDYEATLLSGSFAQTSKYMSGRSEINDVHELLENMVNKLFIHFKELFKSDSKEDTSDEKRRRASAWYMTPFEAIDSTKRTYFGFSWTITEVLCELFVSKHRPKEANSEHNCISFAAKILDDFFANECLYSEPKFDESIDINDKRQTIMEKRCNTAEKVISAWLERQDHIAFKRRNKKGKIISSLDPVWSDMDRKLRRVLMANRINLLEKARKSNESLETAGSLVIKFFKESVDNWFSVDTLDDNNRIVDTPLVKFGFSAFITLNNFFKTRDISHIIDLSPKFRKSLEAFIRSEVFFIGLPVISRKGKDGQKDAHLDTNLKFTHILVQRPEEFIERLKRLSGAIDIYLEPYRLKTKSFRFYYAMTVIGTVWSIQVVKNFICHPSFRRRIADSDKNRIKKSNLRYKADLLRDREPELFPVKRY